MRSRILTVFMIPLSVIIGAVLGEILVRTLTPFPINVETANTVPHEQLRQVVDSRFPEIDADGFRTIALPARSTSRPWEIPRRTVTTWLRRRLGRGNWPGKPA